MGIGIILAEYLELLKFLFMFYLMGKTVFYLGSFLQQRVCFVGGINQKNEDLNIICGK